jgi:hypothetical protein
VRRKDLLPTRSDEEPEFGGEMFSEARPRVDWQPGCLANLGLVWIDGTIA